MSYTPGCWFAANVIGSGSCEGRLVRCHLVPRQLLRREFGDKLARKFWEDKRSWVWGCGGPTGVGGHHGMLDHSRTLRIERRYLPPELEEFAADLNLAWYLDREYGPREDAA